MTFDKLATRLTPHYSHFRVGERLLFTGHSHQAWPDVAREGMVECYDMAAKHVDEKWGLAFDKAEILRGYLRDWYQDPDGLYCLAGNTHMLLVSWLSSLGLTANSRIITTSSEFHSMYRQLHRLAEEGIEVVMVDPQPAETFVDRIAEAINDSTAAIMMSRVFFETGLICQSLADIAKLAREKEIPFLIDDYHGTNVAPLSITTEELADCYLVTGGYKYLQWGEGNCFLRYPKDCKLRPVVTGWYASFTSLEQARSDKPTHYDDGNQRFATATYDPTSQFRAAKVVEFFKEQELTQEVLRNQYVAQLTYFRDSFKNADLNPDIIQPVHEQSLDHNGGFLSFKTSYAGILQSALNDTGVLTDNRGDILRFGVAPYIRKQQIDDAVAILSRWVNQL